MNAHLLLLRNYCLVIVIQRGIVNLGICIFKKYMRQTKTIARIKLLKSSNISITGNPPQTQLKPKVELSRNLYAERFCMEKSKYSGSKILAIIKQVEAGTPVLPERQQ